MTYNQIQAEHQKEIGKIIKDNGVFFAFSNEQFEKEAGNQKIDDLASIGIVGGYMPKKNVDRFKKEIELLEEKKLEAIKKINPEEVILYELKNHEAFYSGEIEDAFEVLKNFDFTYEQVYKVYKKYLHQFDD